jgi:molecular chaperone GrpE
MKNFFKNDLKNFNEDEKKGNEVHTDGKLESKNINEETNEDFSNLVTKLSLDNENLSKESSILKDMLHKQNDILTQKENELLKLINEVDKWKSYAAQFKSEMDSIIVRNEKSIAETKEYAVTKFAQDILVVVDSFEKAIENMKEDIGIAMIMKELLNVLKSHEVFPVESNAVEFDPAFHMAVSQDHNDSVPDNYVIETLRRGYKIGNRCLREALVKVNKRVH